MDKPELIPRIKDEIGDNPNYCDCVSEQLASISQKLPDGSLLVLRSYSYPFQDVHIYRTPDLVKLIQLAQDTNKLPWIYDVKVIVLKRQWVEAIVSACLHRFGDCDKRALFLPRFLSELQTELLQIDPEFWMLLDFNDLVSRPVKYANVLQTFLQLKDERVVANALKNSVRVRSNNPKDPTYKDAWKELQEEGNDRAMKMIHLAFYNSHNKYRWPLFDSPFFLVTPESREFLDSKTHVVLSQ
ncbi:hypothetical protein RFI_11710 [Reticulomyxa filosa]|uniref:Uncharacterized protein n=1 Tax=Reticulomyxa filosa TaxID=46433 RepID=X6NJB3_RETFI|nr:hypothetical protein RFI_11710 [Reticulomyxa filosa]|eukprot:ETO25427.1 hypothetical protein RFI_11710 [Reticulomyxa filosa]